MKDYYAILGVAKTAPEEVILAAYKALERKLNPLRHKEVDIEGATSYTDVIEAYMTLSSNKKRAAYDAEYLSHIDSEHIKALNSDDPLERAWHTAIQFHKSDEIQQEYLRLTNISVDLGREYQKIILKKQLLESPVAQVESMLAEHFSNEFGDISKWMRKFIEILYAKKLGEVVEEVRLSIDLMRGSIDEMEIIRVIAAKHSLQEIYNELHHLKSEQEAAEKEKQERELEIARSVKQNEADLKDKQEQHNRRAAAEQLQQKWREEQLKRRDAKLLRYVLIPSICIVIFLFKDLVSISKPAEPRTTFSSQSPVAPAPKGNRVFLDIDFSLKTKIEKSYNIPALLHIVEAEKFNVSPSNQIICLPSSKTCLSLNQLIDYYRKSFPQTDKIYTRLGGSYAFSTADSRYLLVAIDSLVGGEGFSANTCHVCAPTSNIFLLKNVNNYWAVVGNISNPTSDGSWGKSYISSIDNIILYHLGGDKYHLLIAGGYMAQGYLTEGVTSYNNNTNQSNDFKYLGGVNLTTDGCGARDDNNTEELIHLEISPNSEKYPVIKALISQAKCNSTESKEIRRIYDLDKNGKYQKFLDTEAGDGLECMTMVAGDPEAQKMCALM